MSKRIRLVVSDVDGTLVRHDKSLSDGVVAAVERLKAAGVGFTLISARPPSGILWLADKLGPTGPMGAFNGGTLVRADGTVISAAHVPVKDAKRALEMIDAAGVEPWVFAQGCWYARDGSGLHADRERLSAGIDPTVREDFSDLLGAVDKMVAVSDDEPKLASLEREIAEALGEGATVGRSQTYYLDITARAANKGAGIEAVAKAAGAPLDQVAAFGDQHNDLAMFARAGLSVCMGQGPQDVRAKADHVSKSNDEDGVADAIDRFVLPLVKDAT